MNQTNEQTKDDKTNFSEWNHSTTLQFDQASPPPKTRGEKIFNAISWGFFGWIVNAMVSVKLADFAENRFRPLFTRGGQWMADTALFKKAFKDPGERGKLASSLFSVIALLPGGYSILAPVWAMERHKPFLVRKFDEWFGPKNPDENTKELIEARHSYLDSAPQLNWGDMIKGRTLPVAGIIATHMAFASDKANVVNAAFGEGTFHGLNRIINATGGVLHGIVKNPRFPLLNKWNQRSEAYLQRGLDKQISKASQKTYHEAGKTFDGSAYYLENGHLRNGAERMRGFMNNISVDLLYSAIVAFETFILGHLSAFRRTEKQEKREAVREGREITQHPKFQLDEPAMETQPPSASTQHPRPQIQLNTAEYQDRIPQQTELAQARG